MRKPLMTKKQQEACLDAIHDARVDGRNFASELRNVRNALTHAGQTSTASNVESRIFDAEKAIGFMDRLEEFVKGAEIV